VGRNSECRRLRPGRFTYLKEKPSPASPCAGRDSVQIHERARALDLGVFGLRLKPLVDDVRQNDFLLRFRIVPMK